MRVGLTVWDTRISPVADTATEVLVAQCDGATWATERRVPLGGEGHGRMAGRIAALELDVLVCGAVSRRFGALLEQSGVRVLPWVAGEWQDVLDAVASGELTPDRFVMAGCGRRRGSGRNDRRGRGCGDGSGDGHRSGSGRGRRSGAGPGRGRGGGQ